MDEAKKQELINAVVTTIQNKLPDVRRQSLVLGERAVDSLLSYEDNERSQLSFSEAKKQIAKAIKANESLIKAFRNMHPLLFDTCSFYLEFGESNVGIPAGFYLNNFTENTIYLNDMLKIIEENFAPSPTSRSGPKNGQGINQFIRVLATSYEVGTGKTANSGIQRDHSGKHYKGEFFELVHDCLQAAEQTIHSLPALGKRIERVLSKRLRSYEDSYVTQNHLQSLN